jgi:dCMP deaminase
MDIWDVRHINLAYHVAQWSKDTTKVGAVAVGVNRKDLALGYNGFPPGVADTPERLQDQVTKYALTQHAERNVLDHAKFEIQTIATTMFPCSQCAKSIVSRGVKRVLSPAPLDREPWASDAQFTLLMFREAGIDLVTYALAPEAPKPADNPPSEEPAQERDPQLFQT